jgi:cell division protein FtsW
VENNELNNDSKNTEACQGSISLANTVYILLFLLGLWGCLAILNAKTMSDSPYYFAGRQLIWLFIGMAILFISSRVPFAWYRRWAPPIAILAYLSLIGVLFAGTTINGMKGWYVIGGQSFQPSECAKAPFVLFLCYIACRIEKQKFKEFILMALALVLWGLPIAMQPDMGTLLLYFSAFIMVYWIAGGKIFYLLISFFVSLPFIISFIWTHNYAICRLTGFLNPDANALSSGWHIRQFQYTMARGGFWGANWGKAVWANSYLPLPHTDSAFASLTESVGFMGSFPVIIGFALLVYIAYKLATQCKNNFNRVFIMGTASLITVQAFLHISVNSALLPTTGITLPMLSYGGSSLIATMLAFGMILSASREKE